RDALTSWAQGADEQDGRAAEIVGRIYERYRAVLSAIGRSDAELAAADALDALRRAPGLWGGTPVLFYGFDDLTAPERDVIETLAVVVGAPVTVGLSYEPGRVAFAARAVAFETLRPWASEIVALAPATDHYCTSARRSLSHVERALFEPLPDGAAIDQAQPGAVVLLEGATSREELELIAQEIREMILAGMAPSEIAVVHRTPAEITDALSEVLAEYAVPFDHQPLVRFAATALGCGLLALLRCALLDGDAEDLVRWLGTPGVVRRVELVDRFERDLRRTSVAGLEQARGRWEAEHWELSAIDRVREAAGAGPRELIDSTERELWALFERPRARRGTPLVDGEEAEAAALAEGVRALGQLRELVNALAQPAASVAAALGSPSEVVALLEGLRLSPQRATAAEGAVAVLDPLSLRARRVRALFLCGLQERVFPAPARAQAYFDDEERRALAERRGLLLKHDEDALGGERYLFYACLSRPRERLVLSWHAADDDGRATPRSLFVDDLCDLFAGGLPVGRDPLPSGESAERSSGGVAGAGGAACGTEREPLASGFSSTVTREVCAERMWSASSLETWVRCPVRWYVETIMRPAALEPDPEAQVTGSVMHEVLRAVLEGLRSETGSARITPQSLTRACELMRRSLAVQCDEVLLAATPERSAGVRRWIEASVERYLSEAAEDEMAFEPEHFEVGFGMGAMDGTELAALELGDGVRVRGRIDRVDVGPGGTAVVYDYKRSLRDGMAGAKWVSAGALQLAIYMRAARDLLGLDVVGGLYQPLTGPDLRGRGAMCEEAAQAPVRTDRFDRAAFEELLEETLDVAREAAEEAAAGRVQARPATGSWRGDGCSYPAICRAGRGTCG
ncbi:MAG: PD-(D/E)XK nuclease family protein, partial [Solirubrobacteraceae bacterium]